MPSRTRRGKTVAEALYPAAPRELVSLAKAWCADASERIIGAVWRGYDAFVKDADLKGRLADATDDLERGITRQLEPHIREQLSRDEPFYVQHGVAEDESRKPKPARPPEYDIAFIFRANPRIMWPLEAKVMKKPTDAKDYAKTLNERYLTGTYAPFTPEGAMVGYLLSGRADDAFEAIKAALCCRYSVPAAWASRPHRVSSHKRTAPKGKLYPARFWCHHLLMVFANDRDG